MSTRSYIIQRQDDGSYRGIYCHWDGYPAWVGKKLKQHYRTPKQVTTLMNLGSLSSLGDSPATPEVVKRYGFSWDFDEAYKGLDQKQQDALHADFQHHTTAYHRDRGDRLEVDRWDNYAELLKSMNRQTPYFAMIEYLYLYQDNHWLINRKDWQGFTPLTNARIQSHI